MPAIMNQRIIELAHEVFSFKYKTSPYELNPGHHMDHLHKFAELIVGECIQVGGPEDSYTDEWFKAKADSIQKIKEHFGVE